MVFRSFNKAVCNETYVASRVCNKICAARRVCNETFVHLLYFEHRELTLCLYLRPLKVFETANKSHKYIYFVEIQQVSGRSVVHGPVCYSATVRIYLANKAAQKIYNKHNV